MYEENAVLHALCTRRSVRSYNSTKPVEQEKIQAVLTAGQYAPTGMNRMPTKFVVIRNPEMLHQLSKQCSIRCRSGQLLDSPCKRNI